MEILFATSNQNKVREAAKIGAEYGVSFKQISLLYPEVRAESVAEVALEGARYVHNQINHPVLVEDSGLFIDELNGFPGPYSAYVFHKIGCQGILDLLKDCKHRKARFISAVGYASGDELKVFEGVCEGEIAFGVFGEKGFGYDPIFIPDGFEKTFAQDEKNKHLVSHRRISVEELCRYIKGEST